MDVYSQLITNIIKEQENIIGPVALEQAQDIDGLEAPSLEKVKVTGKAREVIAKLVDRYVYLFGPASIEVCKEAARETRPPVPEVDLPEALR